MFFVTPCSSSPSSPIISLSHPTKLQSSHDSLFTTPRSHDCCFSPPKLSGQKIDRPPLLATVRFRFSESLVVQCSCVDSPIDLKGSVFSFFRGISLREEETELLLMKNPSLEAISLEKIRSRTLSLQSLGINSFTLHKLVTTCPTILTAEEVGQVINFLQNDLEGKLEPAQLERLLYSIDKTSLADFDRKVKLLLYRGIPKEEIVNILNKVNVTKFIVKNSLKDIERIISFLIPYGGIRLILRRPAILNYNLDRQLIPRVEVLTKLSGGDKNATGTVIYRLPAILNYSVEHVQSHVELLRSFAGLTDDQIFKIVFVFPNMISTSKERKLQPRIEFLKQCDLTPNDIFKFLTKAPLFLALSFEDNLARKLGFLFKIGYKPRTKELAMAMGAMTRTSCENLQKVIGLFLNYGLSYADIFAMSNKHPQVLQYNHTSLVEKMEYLVKEMGREVKELLAFPAFLGYKFDDRIKLRYEVKKRIRGANMSLNKLLTVSAEDFLTKGEKEVETAEDFLTDEKEVETAEDFLTDEKDLEHEIGVN